MGRRYRRKPECCSAYMPRVVISRSAQRDIQRTYQFLSEKDRLAASKAVRAIQQAFSPLRRQPGMGRPIEDEPELRELIIDFGSAGYVALYHYVPGGEQITILAIQHQREGGFPLTG